VNPIIGRTILLIARWSVLDDVVEVLRLMRLDVRARVGLNALDGRGVRAAFVDRDLLRHAMRLDGSFQEKPRRSVISISTK
jgi:hypothetical protein